MTTREKCLELQKRGLTQTEIAEIVGVSRQRVAQICGKYHPGHFKEIREDGCVYPIWRQWMNDNRITRTELIRRMGLPYHAQISSLVSNWMRGRNYPTKESIDKLIAATGLSYEQLFYREA